MIIPIGVLMFIANYIAFIEPLLLGEVNLNYRGGLYGTLWVP